MAGFQLLAYIKAHYFSFDELNQARHILETSWYEDAIAHLVQRGLETLRHSGEAKAPHLYITIPGGKLIVYRPNRPIGVFDHQFMEELLLLADWTQGIRAILGLQKGSHKQSQWSEQILAIWHRQEQETLFPLREPAPLAWTATP